MTPLEARLAKGYTQAYLSYRARISERTIRTAEHTGAWPRRSSTRRRYAKVLGVSPKDLAVHPPWAELLAEREARLRAGGAGVIPAADPALVAPQSEEACVAYGLPQADDSMPVASVGAVSDASDLSAVAAPVAAPVAVPTPEATGEGMP